MLSYYQRVLPRDLFNEANLLKCIGQLVMLIEDRKVANLVYEYDGLPFDIGQDSADGSLFVYNIEFFYQDDPRYAGTKITLRRAMNSRDPWPLYEYNSGDPIFDNNGNIVFDFSSLKEN